MFQKFPENFAFQLFIIFSSLLVKFAIFLKSSPLFNSFYCLLFINKTLGFNNLKIKTDMNAKISAFVIYMGAIIHLPLYNLHNSTFKTFIQSNSNFVSSKDWLGGGRHQLRHAVLCQIILVSVQLQELDYCVQRKNVRVEEQLETLPC